MMLALLAVAATLGDGTGRGLFLNGRTESRVPTAELRSTATELPATMFACATCHGRTALGSTEAGVKAPAIDGPALKLRGYDQVKLARTLRDGIGQAATTLHPAMPSYRLTDGEISSLFEYLEKLPEASSSAVGVSDVAVRVGVALPMSGPNASTGAAIRAALAATFKGVYLYGRRIDLVLADTQEGQIAAVQRLLAKEQVLALVGSPLLSSPDLDALLKEGNTPLIGPIAASPDRRSALSYYLLPTLSDQLRVLADYMGSRNVHRPGVLYSSSALFETLRRQFEKNAVRIAYQQELTSALQIPSTSVRELRKADVDAVVFLGGEEQFQTLARALDRDGLNVPIATLSATAGRGVFRLPEQIARRIVLAHGALIPEQSGLAGLENLLAESGGEAKQLAVQAMAAAAGRVFLEAAKRCGRDLSRESMRAVLESLQNFQTGLTPAVSFSPNRTVGSSGAYIVGVDAPAGRYLPLTQWLLPQQRNLGESL